MILGALIGLVAALVIYRELIQYDKHKMQVNLMRDASKASKPPVTLNDDPAAP